MSDLMLIGVLRMPLPDDPAEVDPWTWAQLRGRIQEAATRIGRDADEIDHLRADLREERDRVARMRVEHDEEVGDLPEKVKHAEDVIAKAVENEAEKAALFARARHAEDCLEAAKARIAALDVELVQEKFAHMGQAALESLVETQRMMIAELEARHSAWAAYSRAWPEAMVGEPWSYGMACWGGLPKTGYQSTAGI